MKSAPTDGTQFQMFWWGEWMPRVKIEDGWVWSLELVEKDYNSWIDWRRELKLEHVIDSKGVQWAPQPTDPFVKE